MRRKKDAVNKKLDKKMLQSDYLSMLNKINSIFHYYYTWSWRLSFNWHIRKLLNDLLSSISNDCKGSWSTDLVGRKYQILDFCTHIIFIIQKNLYAITSKLMAEKLCWWVYVWSRQIFQQHKRLQYIYIYVYIYIYIYRERENYKSNFNQTWAMKSFGAGATRFFDDSIFCSPSTTLNIFWHEKSQIHFIGTWRKNIRVKKHPKHRMGY